MTRKISFFSLFYATKTNTEEIAYYIKARQAMFNIKTINILVGLLLSSLSHGNNAMHVSSFTEIYDLVRI